MDQVQIYQANFWAIMFKDRDDIVPLAEDEVANLINQCIETSWATNNAEFISLISSGSNKRRRFNKMISLIVQISLNK